MTAIDLSESRSAFRTALVSLGVHPADATRAADLFAAVVPKTLARLAPEGLDGLKPVAFPSGERLYVHTCNNVEWWHEPTQGPINEQGCDACESAPYPDGWRPVYARNGGESR